MKSSKKRLRKYLQEISPEKIVGVSGLAFLASASLFSLIPPTDQLFLSAILAYLGGLGLNVTASLLEKSYRDLLSSTANDDNEKITLLADGLTSEIESDPVLRRELDTLLDNLDAFQVTEEIVKGDPTAHGWLLARIFSDTAQYREDFSKIHDTLAEIKKLLVDSDLEGKSNTLSSEMLLLKIDLSDRRDFWTWDISKFESSLAVGEALYREGKLPNELIDLIHEAREHREKQYTLIGYMTTLRFVDDLKHVKFVRDKLRGLLIEGATIVYDANVDYYRDVHEALEDANRLYYEKSSDVLKHEVSHASMIIQSNPIGAIVRLQQVLELPLEISHQEELKRFILKIHQTQEKKAQYFVTNKLTPQERESTRLVIGKQLTLVHAAHAQNSSPILVKIEIDRTCQKLQSFLGLDRADLDILRAFLVGYSWE